MKILKTILGILIIISPIIGAIIYFNVGLKAIITTLIILIVVSICVAVGLFILSDK